MYKPIDCAKGCVLDQGLYTINIPLFEVVFAYATRIDSESTAQKFGQRLVAREVVNAYLKAIIRLMQVQAG